MPEINAPVTGYVAPPAASPEEALVQNYFRWELRGRGWQLWLHPSELEPPFRPFRHHVPSRFLEFQDDGRVPSFFDRLGSWLAGKSEGAAATEPLDCGPIDPPAEIFDNHLPLVEIEVVLPPGLKIGKEVCSQLFISLTYCTYPLGFEILGRSDSIIIQLVCREPDLYPLRQQFAAYFPEAVLTERRHVLVKSWYDTGPFAVIADFGLSREFFIPLKTFSGFEIDPLIAVAGALSDLRPEELGVLQIVFQPARHPWAESILRAVTDGQGKPFFYDAPEMVSHARTKISHPLYAASIRVAGRAPTEERAWDIVRALGGSLAHFAHPTANELIPLTNDEYPDEVHEDDLLDRKSHRCGMLLNSDELVSIVHPPSASVRAKQLKRQSKKSKASPGLANGHKLVLGINETDAEVRPVTLSDGQRLRHTYVIGASGTGKSTFLLNLITQDIESGGGIAVLDPHGDLIDGILERIPEERYGDVIIFDPSDEEYPIGFNILSAHSEVEKHLLASDLASVFKRLSTSWGDQMTSVLGNAILSFLESDRGGTLADLRRFLVEKDYRADFLKSVKDPENVYYWQREFPLLSGKPQAPLLTRLDTFLRPKLIRYMVAQKENKLDFGEIMNGRKIFLAKLSQGAIGEENSYLLGTLLVSKFHQMTLARQEIRESERRPFYLYIDEFHNFVTPSMASILSGARKYGLGLILAHQELRQLGLGTSEIASAVISNPYTRVCFRLGDQDAHKLSDGFSYFEPKDLQNLGTGEAICRLERSEFDFNLKVPPLAPVEGTLAQERRERIAQLSRQRYGTRRDLVEQQLGQSVSAAAEVGSVPPPEPPKRKPKVEPGSLEQAAPPPAGAKQPIRESDPPFAGSNKPAAAIRPASLEPVLAGRGGRQHKYIQQLIKQWTEGMGWRAEIEKEILAGSVDILLSKGKVSIACEISITSTPDQEAGNIQKCLAVGFSYIVVVAPESKQLRKIQEAVAQKIDPLPPQVRFLTVEELFAFIETLEAEAASAETTVHGYKVNVKFRSVDEAEKKMKKQAISQVMLTSSKKFKKDNK